MIPKRVSKYRPDVLVRCGPSQNKTYVTDPVVGVEVLSPSTIDNDRGRKLRFYKNMPTARHIVLVYSDQMRVEHYAWMSDGWPPPYPPPQAGEGREGVLTAPERVLTLDAVEFGIALSQIYFDVVF
jgi:Uma2 family endonuclease